MAQPDDRCQIYLCMPDDIDSSRLDALIDAGGLDHVSCLMLNAGPSGIDPRLAEKLVAAAQGRDLPFVIDTDIETAARLGADGVHIGADDDAYDAARDRLGDDAIIGAACGLSRHDALTMAERGADYVAFSGPGEEDPAGLVAWWSQVTVVPCVAWDIADEDTAVRFAAAGADFVAANIFAWERKHSPEQALRQLSERLAGVKAAA